MGNDIFHPPTYIPSDQEHKLAYRKYMLESIFYDYLLGINMARGGKFGKMRSDQPTDAEYIEKELSYIDTRFNKWRDAGEGKDVWEYFRSFEDFKKWSADAFSGPHDGDCVKQPAPCSRCHMEEFYELQSTVIWCSCIFYKNKTCEKCKK